jgi:hypothetical protein
MDEILAQLFPQAPSYFPGLLGQEQANLLQQQAQRQGLLGIGMGLLQAAAPSTTRPSLGAGIAQGLATGQQMAQNVYAQRLQEQQIAQKLAEQQRQLQQRETMRRLFPQVFQQTVERGAVAGEEGPIPTAQPRVSIDPLKLSMLAMASDNPLDALSNIGKTVQQLRQAGLTTGAIGETDPFTPFLASDNENIRNMAANYSRSFRTGALDEPAINRAVEVMSKMLETAGKPSSLRGDYEYAMAQRTREGQPTISFEQYQENIRKAGAGTTSTVVYPPGAVAPGAGAQSEIDKALLSSGSRLQVLNRISEGYRPEFLQTRFKVAQGLVELGEKLGREPNPEERQNLEQYSRFKQDAVRQLNQYINEITGAAIGQGEEAERLKSGVPNPGTGLFGGDSPTVFLSKLNNTVRDLRLAEARLQYIKTKGFNLQDVTLDQMPTIMRKRKEQIVKDFGLDEANATDREVLRNRLAAEFGLL